MKRVFPFLLFILFTFHNIQAQTPQFAVVRPDGTTYICPSWDSAYNKAVDGDNIYLPGGSYNFNNQIKKQISIYGAGCSPDSAQITGTTVLSGVAIGSGSSNGSITGCYITSGPIVFAGSISGYQITRCYITSGIRFDSVCNNIIISGNYIGAFGQGCLYGGSWSLQLLGQNNYISNNFITSVVSSSGGNSYYNNIFTYCQQWCSTSLSCYGELFENNIFSCASSGVHSSTFRNNIGRTNGIDGQNNQGYNNYTINTPIDSLFISLSNSTFWESNLHLRPNSPFLAAGTDGNELGIYGGTNSWMEGLVPSNPHIYFKQVAPNTNASGQLPVQFKVRTTN